MLENKNYKTVSKAEKVATTKEIPSFFSSDLQITASYKTWPKNKTHEDT